MSDIDQIEKRLKNHEERISKLERLFQTKPENIQKKLSIKEFILSKKSKSDIQRTLAMGYYLEKYENLTSFNAKDLENGFRRAKENVPGNINNQVIRNIQKGYMMEARDKKDNRKAWYLTNSGDECVSNNFQEEK